MREFFVLTPFFKRCAGCGGLPLGHSAVVSGGCGTGLGGPHGLRARFPQSTMYRLLDLHSLWGHSGDAAAAQQCQIHALDTCSGLPYTDRLLGFLVVLLIVGIAFVYEGAMHSIEHRCPAELRPTLMRVLSEMAQLGFVSTLVHIPSKTNWFVGLSGRLFSDCNHLLHLVHDIHFLVFWAMLAFLVYNLLLLCGSIVWGQQWARYEKLAMVEIDPAQLRRCVVWVCFPHGFGRGRGVNAALWLAPPPPKKGLN